MLGLIFRFRQPTITAEGHAERFFTDAGLAERPDRSRVIRSSRVINGSRTTEDGLENAATGLLPRMCRSTRPACPLRCPPCVLRSFRVAANFRQLAIRPCTTKHTKIAKESSLGSSLPFYHENRDGHGMMVMMINTN
jgi:hypothetical protein